MITVTWKQFLTAIFLLTSVYYLVVWLLYYRKDKFRVLIKKRVTQAPIQVMPAALPVEKPVNKAAEISNAANSDNMGEVHDLTNEIYALILQSSAQKDDKPTLEKALIKLLHKYPAVTSKTIRTSIELMIAADTENHAGIQFTAEELTALWDTD